MALPALGVVNEQHAEQLFVLADRLTDTHAAAARLLAATRGGRVRADVSAWWQLVIVAGAAAAGVLVLSCLEPRPVTNVSPV